MKKVRDFVKLTNKDLDEDFAIKNGILFESLMKKNIETLD